MARLSRPPPTEAEVADARYRFVKGGGKIQRIEMPPEAKGPLPANPKGGYKAASHFDAFALTALTQNVGGKPAPDTLLNGHKEGKRRRSHGTFETDYYCPLGCKQPGHELFRQRVTLTGDLKEGRCPVCGKLWPHRILVRFKRIIGGGR